MVMGMLASLTQFYSDDLTQETKQGKGERNAQGLYNRSLPFGMMKGPNGVPVPDPATIDGLRLAFRLCAGGCAPERAKTAGRPSWNGLSKRDWAGPELPPRTQRRTRAPS
jgi:hypothetical protein